MAGDWRQQRERGTPGALRLIRWIALHLGRAPARLILFPITGYFLLTAPRVRRASSAFQRRAGLKGGWGGAFRHIHCFAATILDRVFFLAGRWDRFEISVHGAEELQAIAAEGCGGLLLGSHLGSFEVLRSLGVTRGEVPIKVLMHHDHNQTITRMLDSLNPEVAETVIPLGQPAALLEAGEFVASGGVLGILADRLGDSEKQVNCRFFGEEVPFPAGPALMAATLKAPVLSFVGLYLGSNRYAIRLERLAEPYEGPRSGRQAYVERTMQAYAERLEHYVRQHPYNWFNFYDYWDGDAHAAA